MKKIVFLCVFAWSTLFCYSQKKYKIRTVAFYNLENLFDTFDNPNTRDEESPILKIKANRNTIYRNKIHNLARVISEIGINEAKNCPTIIGLAEIENRKVLEDLLLTPYLKHKNYQIIHFDSPDLRGIDVALLYQTNYFNPIHFEAIELKLWTEEGFRIYTRDQLVVSGYLDDELIHIIVNHWPSRRGGEKKSRSKREKAAELNTKIIHKIKLTNPNPKIIVMGDFNDNPTNSSIKKVLKAKKNKKNVNEGELYNPFENMFKKGSNTYVHNSNISLFDQIIISHPFLTIDKDFSSFKIWKANIFNPPYLTTQKRKFKGYPFRSFVNNTWNGGFSDHYPVYIYLIKEIN